MIMLCGNNIGDYNFFLEPRNTPLSQWVFCFFFMTAVGGPCIDERELGIGDVERAVSGPG